MIAIIGKDKAAILHVSLSSFKFLTENSTSLQPAEVAKGLWKDLRTAELHHFLRWSTGIRGIFHPETQQIEGICQNPKPPELYFLIL
jgi:hypothetical protein